MSTVYEDKSYGQGTVGFGEKVGIMVVDFQRAFTDPEFKMGGSELIERGVVNTARLLKVAREAGIPVASCYVGYNNEREMPHWKVDEVRNLIIGTPGTEIDPRIHNPDYDVVIRKTGPSIFFGTPAASYMAREHVDTVVVTGCVTSGCIRASVIDSFSLGYRTIVPEDCVGDHEEEAHKANLADVNRRYADIVTADDCIAWIEQYRGRNEA